MKKTISILLAIIMCVMIFPLNTITAYAESKDLTAHILADRILQENLVPKDHLELSTMDSKELATLTSCAKKIVSGLTTDYQKIEAVCKYVATNVYYDYDCYYGRTDYTYFTPYDVLKNGYAVCAGYARLSEELLNIVGISCVRVVGENHVYNAAYDSISQKWIYFDATWCSGNVYENSKKIKGDYNSFFFDISLKDLYAVGNHEITMDAYAIEDGICIKQGNVVYSLFTPSADTPKQWRDVNNWYLVIVDHIGKPSTVVINDKDEKYNLPVKQVGWSAFEDCTSLQNVIITSGVEEISQMAFFGCESLTSITIPDTVETIGNCAFGCCSSLKNVYYSGTKTEWSKVNIIFGNEDLLSAKIHYNYVLNGWVKENGKWTFYQNNVKVRNTWKKDSIGWCYLGANGYMLTNSWLKDNGKWYFLDADGHMLSNKWKKDKQDWCYLGPTGAMLTNYWVRDSVGWCYVGGNGYCVKNCWKKDSKGWCYLDSNGRMATNKWVEDSVGWCYVGADGYCVTNCWKRDSKGWCYLDSDGRMATNKWVEDSIGWCYVGLDGYCVTSQWVQESDKMYYVDANGYRVTGNVTIDGTEYIFNEDGELVINTDIPEEPESPSDPENSENTDEVLLG